ncbi:dihydroorotate dehydrogenase (fumarate) [Alternaria panax]|uniref:Dihydroorotate dehydrogenase (fumarate) n=1 Tax=Alternaria panax TaxID=48097 RepID=A0AAD4I8C7_9PLEO|nr:dihydroorotate dehydrogenase (fumarate) [Alternaria panax]
MASLTINPPLLNSANPWCTTLGQLQELYNSPHTGAITTRTSLISGFPHDPNHHQFTFFNPSTHASSTPNKDLAGDSSTTGSLNTLGYSPLPLSTYLTFVQTISDNLDDDAPPPHGRKTHKPIIISVTGSAKEIAQCYHAIRELGQTVKMRLAMEINLSCPNIPGKTPPAYDFATLAAYLEALKTEIDIGLIKMGGQPEEERVAIGIKVPPYTYQEQFDGLVGVLEESVRMRPVYLACPVSFVTAVNTLGSSLLLAPLDKGDGGGGVRATLKSANGSGLGGLAGAPLHPLALGNVYAIRTLLDKHEGLKEIMIIGTGGVEDQAGLERMKSVGAGAVGVGTALGRKGVDIFGEITQGKTDH